MDKVTLLGRDWRRFHDSAAVVLHPGATVHCVDVAEDVIAICSTGISGRKLKAAGSHWALSTATDSDGEFIEMNWPGTDNVPRNSGYHTLEIIDPRLDLYRLINDQVFDRLLNNPPKTPDVLSHDPCLDSGLTNCFFVHLKSGTKVFETYSLLDRSPDVITELASKLNEKLAGGPNAGAFNGPWAFATLGGAGGQTVFGALTTGTHGGDFLQRPIADSVVAMHLIADGGRHYWIEPAQSQFEMQLTDDAKIKAAFAAVVTSRPIEIIRDDDMFYSVLVGPGRFGVVMSAVLRVVPQYCLLEHRRLDSWERIKNQLKTGGGHFSFVSPVFPGDPGEAAADRNKFERRFGQLHGEENRFLQFAIHLSPDGDRDHLCGVTQRWFYPQFGPEARDPDGNLRGRNERGTVSTAGRSDAYSPPDDDGEFAETNGTFLTRACGNGNFVAGVLREAAREIEKIISGQAILSSSSALEALGIGAGTLVLATAGLCPALAAAALALAALAELLENHDESLAGATDKAIKSIMDNPLIPDFLGVMIIRCVLRMVFKKMQSNRDYVALSYAVMDGHDYLDRSCYGNAESIEVFFDADRPDLYCAYVDQILSFEAMQQEQNGDFSVGYVSLRYVKGSQGLIAPSRFENTVVIEVAGIRDASGSLKFVNNAANVARHRMYSASFHWGQMNPLNREEVERHFGTLPGTRLARWRDALRKITDDGRHDAFSSNFTRQTGLEPI